MEVVNKLAALRKVIKEQHINAFLQPVHDEYMSEYPPASNRRAEWISGFLGSAGTVVVLENKAGLFIDGRYTLQAQQESDPKLFEQHNSGQLSVENWLASQLNSGDRVGYDAKLYTQAMVRRMKSALDKKGIELVPVPNLVDLVWSDRPTAPATALMAHDQKHAGETSEKKRARMAALVKEAGADCAVIAAPDNVCWLLNIRGRDVPHTPLVLSAALLMGDGGVKLFVSPERAGAVKAHLGAQVECCEPSSLESALAALKGQRVLCDPQAVPVWYTQQLTAAGAELVEAPDPCTLTKAMKNETELQAIRNAHMRDGVAVARLLCWLDQKPADKAVSEIDVSVRLAEFRSQVPGFVEPSFTTIAGSGPHGAIVHYRVTPESNRTLQEGELFLLDSGGQYPDGTTDITRTVAIGTPSAEHRDRYTRVLKGHIAIATAQFPAGTTGSQLDALARQYLWQAGLDYDHGTGHGVGCFLGVHEGPQRISKRGGDAPLKAGMIVSNEPGYYKTGEYGIRIENLVAVTEGPGLGWLSFQTVTCAPLDTRLIEISMLTSAEKEWLNAYHRWVVSTLSPSLNEKERDWLVKRCEAV